MRPLSAEPDLEGLNILSNLQGSFSIRVAAKNIAGLGLAAELIVELEGL